MQSIHADDIRRRIRLENPWWLEGGGIDSNFSKMPRRAYFDLFLPLVADRQLRRAVVLMGPRRVGKTVLMHHAIQALLDHDVPPTSICYCSVDHPVYNGLSLEQLFEHCQQCVEAQAGTREIYFFLDEIQYLRRWEVHLKTFVDSRTNVKCVASGSAAAALRLKSAESGAGRFTDFLLPPLTFYEYLLLQGKGAIVQTTSVEDKRLSFSTSEIQILNDHFVAYLNFGGYPEVVFSETIQSDPARFIKSDIIDKVLLRDLPSLYGIQDIQELNYLFTTLAFNTAQEISLNELSQNSGVAKNTIKRYIEYLEAAFLIRQVHRVDHNARRFDRANFFKVYLTNPSMRAALFTPVSADDAAMPTLTETAIFSQWFHSDQSTLHYARWAQGEVDLVMLGPNQEARWAVEVKWSDRFWESPDELKSAISFCQNKRLGRILVTSKTKSGIRNIGDLEIEFVPASLYCFQVGYNIVRGKSLAGVATSAMPSRN
jgi:uncharacterized protein